MKKIIITLIVFIGIINTNLGQYTYQDHLRDRYKFYPEISQYDKPFAPAWSFALTLDAMVPFSYEYFFDTHHYSNSKKAWIPKTYDQIRKIADREGHNRSGWHIDISHEFTLDLFRNRAFRIVCAATLRNYEIKYGGSQRLIETKYDTELIISNGIQIMPFTWIATIFRTTDRWRPGILSRTVQTKFWLLRSNELINYTFLVDCVATGRYAGLIQIRHQIESVPGTLFIAERRYGVGVKLFLRFTHISELTLEGGWVQYMLYTAGFKASITREFKKYNSADYKEQFGKQKKSVSYCSGRLF